MSRKRNRAVGKVDKLNPELKDVVDKMLLSGETYREICTYLAEQGEKITQASLCRYAQRFLANAEQLRIAQENFRMLLTETERYPDVDPAEAILRLTSQKVFDAVAKLDEGHWEDVSATKLIKEATALARAVAYKKGVDVRAKSAKEIAVDETQTLLFDTIRKSNPQLYEQLQEELLKIKRDDDVG